MRPQAIDIFQQLTSRICYTNFRRLPNKAEPCRRMQLQNYIFQLHWDHGQSVYFLSLSPWENSNSPQLSNRHYMPFHPLHEADRGCQKLTISFTLTSTYAQALLKLGNLLLLLKMDFSTCTSELFPLGLCFLSYHQWLSPPLQLSLFNDFSSQSINMSKSFFWRQG